MRSKVSRYRMERKQIRIVEENMVLQILILGLLFFGEVHLYRFKRVIGGEDTSIEQFPYMLSMRLNNKHICGAVIIGKYWSLTAAHCCSYPTAQNRAGLSLRSGSAQLYEGGKSHRVTQLVLHELYEEDNDDYDICALKVDFPGFKASSAVGSVRLPQPGPGLDTRKGRVGGWGYYQKTENRLSPILKSAIVYKIDLEECRYLYRNSYIIHTSNVCYGGKNKKKDACQGDSGSPLVNKDSILIGIVSFGDDCSNPENLPGVYIDVVQFRDWIRNVTGV